MFPAEELSPELKAKCDNDKFDIDKQIKPNTIDEITS